MRRRRAQNQQNPNPRVGYRLRAQVDRQLPRTGLLGLIAAEISLAGRCFIQIVAQCSMMGTFGEHFQGALW